MTVDDETADCGRETEHGHDRAPGRDEEIGRRHVTVEGAQGMRVSTGGVEGEHHVARGEDEIATRRQGASARERDGERVSFDVGLEHAA